MPDTDQQLNPEITELIYEEEVALEAERANRLIMAQKIGDVNRQMNELSDKISYFNHSPSYFKYLLLFGLAILCDSLDIASYLLPATVIGAAFSVLIFFGVIGLQILMLYSFWFFDGQIKEAEGYPDTANFIKADMTARIKTIGQLGRNIKVLRAAKTGEEAAEAAKIIRATQAAGRLGRFTRIAKFAGNPMFRLSAGVTIEMFPIVELAPIMLICTFLAYLAENNMIKNAKEAAKEVHEEVVATATQLA